MASHWTVAAIRAKADALEARGAGRITLAIETTTLMVAALRFLATEGMAERPRLLHDRGLGSVRQPHRRAHRVAVEPRRGHGRLRSGV